MSKRINEADLLFGRGRNIPVAEAELLFAMQAANLSRQEKLAVQKQFRAADNDGKWALLDKFCGALNGDPAAVRQALGL